MKKKLSEWCESLVKYYKKIPDIIIHNIGMAINDGQNIINCNLKDVSLSFDVMIKGAYLLTQNFLNIILNNKNENYKQDTKFLFMSSWSGHIGYAGGSKYCLCKHAIEGFVKCLALEFDEMRSNGNQQCKLCAISICPGVVRTELFKDNALLNEYLATFGVETGQEWAEKCSDWLFKLDLEQKW